MSGDTTAVAPGDPTLTLTVGHLHQVATSLQRAAEWLAWNWPTTLPQPVLHTEPMTPRATVQAGVPASMARVVLWAPLLSAADWSAAEAALSEDGAHPVDVDRVRGVMRLRRAFGEVVVEANLTATVSPPCASHSPASPDQATTRLRAYRPGVHLPVCRGEDGKVEDCVCDAEVAR